MEKIIALLLGIYLISLVFIAGTIDNNYEPFNNYDHATSTTGFEYPIEPTIYIQKNVAQNTDDQNSCLEIPNYNGTMKPCGDFEYKDIGLVIDFLKLNWNNIK